MENDKIMGKVNDSFDQEYLMHLAIKCDIEMDIEDEIIHLQYLWRDKSDHNELFKFLTNMGLKDFNPNYAGLEEYYKLNEKIESKVNEITEIERNVHRAIKALLIYHKKLNSCLDKIKSLNY